MTGVQCQTEPPAPARKFCAAAAGVGRCARPLPCSARDSAHGRCTAGDGAGGEGRGEGVLGSRRLQRHPRAACVGNSAGLGCAALCRSTGFAASAMSGVMTGPRCFVIFQRAKGARAAPPPPTTRPLSPCASVDQRPRAAPPPLPPAPPKSLSILRRPVQLERGIACCAS